MPVYSLGWLEVSNLLLIIEYLGRNIYFYSSCEDKLRKVDGNGMSQPQIISEVLKENEGLEGNPQPQPWKSFRNQRLRKHSLRTNALPWKVPQPGRWPR